ncbi:phospholipase D-like domain-containing protein, partial [Citrobacter freundii]
ALVAAKKRGVDVKIVIDERGNTGRASIAAMNYIANSGIPLRTDSDFPIQHDKVIIVDNVTVETGVSLDIENYCTLGSFFDHQ